MWALVVNIKLDICKINYMETDRSAVFGYQAGKIHDLLFCTLAGVRRCMEIYRIDLNATFCDHVTGNRAVDSARKKQHGFSVCSDRHSACARNGLGIYVNLVTDLNRKIQLRMMNIYTCLRERIQDTSAKLCANFHGANRIGFLCTACPNLKGSVKVRMPLFHIAYYVFGKFLKALLFVDHNRADTYDTEYVLQCVYSLIVIIILRAEYIDSSLLFFYFKISLDLGERNLHLMYESIFKTVAVFSLQGDFRIFDQKCMY